MLMSLATTLHVTVLLVGYVQGLAVQTNSPLDNFGREFIGLRIMTYNTWIFGSKVENGLQKIADSILLANPDIVGLQEIERTSANDLLPLLGPGWVMIQRKTLRNEKPDTAILTRHFVDTSTCQSFAAGIGCDIQILQGIGNRTTLGFWSFHLDWKQYGPYSFCEGTKDPNEGPIYRYYPNRFDEMVEIVDRGINARSRDTPIIMVGDLNEPSHLDWTEDAKERHCGHTYKWPVTKFLEDQGFVDAYRSVHPDPAEDPGITWSSNTKYFYGWRGDYSVLEPQDRIDFIYTRSDRLKTMDAIVYQGLGTVWAEPNDLRKSDWPSDHTSVIADVKLFVF